MTLSKNCQGQTLVALLIFIMFAVVITATATTLAVINIQSGLATSSGQQAIANADSGIENAIMSLERNQSYTGETIDLTNGTVTISISGGSTKTITAVGSYANSSRTITAIAEINGSVVTVTSWSETP